MSGGSHSGSGSGHSRSDSVRSRRIGIGGRRLEATIQLDGGRTAEVAGVTRSVIQRREKEIWRAELLRWRSL